MTARPVKEPLTRPSRHHVGLFNVTRSLWPRSIPNWRIAPH